MSRNIEARLSRIERELRQKRSEQVWILAEQGEDEQMARARYLAAHPDADPSCVNVIILAFVRPSPEAAA